MSGSSPKTLVRVDDFPLPSRANIRGILASAALMYASARPSLLEPGSVLHDRLLAGRAQATSVSRWAQLGLFYFLFGAHTLEMLGFAYVRLRRHGVPIFSVLGFKWLLSVFVGGQYAWAHFDEVVAKKAIAGGRAR
ncbi:hypothetical protein Micbo1qcDRAFT_225749 [Microdochium bolleyi]|uniref:Uncharacterized protein n=1 Tax=Microdochium bolleyi TaxID=196109 RepID=A0A136J107_9PEZI|nr:hypothetical protein Micbo1qcDRAFT_225749 [Microdochium bolleyi]